MELNDRVQQLEESMEKFKKELLNEVTEKLEQLAQQFRGKRTTETGETSFNEGSHFTKRKWKFPQLHATNRKIRFS